VTLQLVSAAAFRGLAQRGFVQRGLSLVALAVMGPGVLAGCTTGVGSGEVTSERLYIKNCCNGPFDLQPDFFASDPFDDTQTIRIQRGDRYAEVSDGISILVNGVEAIRGDDGGPGQLGQDLSVGLPVGVSPPGVPIVFNPDPPPVNIALFLNDSCHAQNVTIYAIEGTISFTSLFSGDVNEKNADARLTEGSFDALFADPRELTPNDPPDPKLVSRVTGNFRFFFQRGQPAQPFP
jgi:hypothetical protein